MALALAGAIRGRARRRLPICPLGLVGAFALDRPTDSATLAGKRNGLCLHAALRWAISSVRCRSAPKPSTSSEARLPFGVAITLAMQLK